MESSKSTNRRRFLQSLSVAGGGLFKPRASSKYVVFSRLGIFVLTFILCPYLCAAAPDEPKNLQEVINNTRELRALMQADPHRPIYHFVAPEGHAAPFDANGAIYWKGKYHLGFVYQTRSRGDFFSSKGDYAWGHAVSTDLLHWTFYPNMLEVAEDKHWSKDIQRQGKSSRQEYSVMDHGGNECLLSSNWS